MAYHVRGKFFCGLFQQVRQGDIVEAVDPAVGKLAASNLKRKRSLDILTVKIKMPQHSAAVSGIEETVPDKTGEFLFDL